jgi:hypothetical protein
MRLKTHSLVANVKLLHYPMLGDDLMKLKPVPSSSSSPYCCLFGALHYWPPH